MIGITMSQVYHFKGELINTFESRTYEALLPF